LRGRRHIAHSGNEPATRTHSAPTGGITMKKYGFVASGGGYRSFYTEGALVWLQRHDIPVVHLTSTSSGNNIVLDYLMWDRAREELPPVLTKTLRLSLADTLDVFTNFLGLRPALLPNGAHLLKVNKDRCRKSLLLDDMERRATLKDRLGTARWDIVATNLTQRCVEYFSVNDILAQIDASTLERFMDVFLAGITTIPYFAAVKMHGDYYVEGGYTDNIPLRTLFADPEVDEIIAVDFTDRDYHADLDDVYGKNPLMLLLNSINMNLLVTDIQMNLPGIGTLREAQLINRMIQAAGRTSLEIDGRVYRYKPLHVLRPHNLKSMTIALGDSSLQKKYFELGQREAEGLFQDLLAAT
jgi:predicted acylesterase/phospholipase RssA